MQIDAVVMVRMLVLLVKGTTIVASWRWRTVVVMMVTGVCRLVCDNVAVRAAHVGVGVTHTTSPRRVQCDGDICRNGEDIAEHDL